MKRFLLHSLFSPHGRLVAFDLRIGRRAFGVCVLLRSGRMPRLTCDFGDAGPGFRR